MTLIIGYLNSNQHFLFLCILFNDSMNLWEHKILIIHQIRSRILFLILDMQEKIKVAAWMLLILVIRMKVDRYPPNSDLPPRQDHSPTKFITKTSVPNWNSLLPRFHCSIWYETNINHEFYHFIWYETVKAVNDMNSFLI